jgi:hypothetical protein
MKYKNVTKASIGKFNILSAKGRKSFEVLIGVLSILSKREKGIPTDSVEFFNSLQCIIDIFLIIRQRLTQDLKFIFRVPIKNTMIKNG